LRRRSFSAARASQVAPTAPSCRCDVSISSYSPHGLLLVELFGERSKAVGRVPRQPQRPKAASALRLPPVPSHGLSRRLAVGPARDLRRYESAVPRRLSGALLPVAFVRAKTSCQGEGCAQSDDRARLPDRAPHRRTAHARARTHAHARTHAPALPQPTAHPWHVSRVEMLVAARATARPSRLVKFGIHRPTRAYLVWPASSRLICI
jgi:hypothetical protein